MTRTDREAYWRRHIHAWREGGVSGLAYCEQANISRKQFYTWRKRFANDAWLPVEVEVAADVGAVRIVLGDVEVVVDADSSPVALRLALDALS